MIASVRTHRVAQFVSLLLVSATLPAQQTTTFSTDVKVVNVLATVRDSHGKIVNALTKDDFILEEDGTPQTIRYFARETDAPLSLGLLVDTSRSMSKELTSEKKASAVFANNVLREGKDSAFLIHFDHEVELLRDVTTSREKFVAGLDLLQSSAEDDQRAGGGQRGGGSPGGYPGGGRGSGGGSWRGGGTHLYDSVYLASNEVLNKQQGRKAIVLLTDGVDRGSKMSLEEAVESAQRSNTMVYAIYFEGQEGHRSFDQDRTMGGHRRGGGWPGGGGGYPGGGYPGGGYPGGGYPGGGGGQRSPRPDNAPRVDGKLILGRLSQETGGRMFVVSKKDPIEKIYSDIQDELRNQYNLGYTSDHKDDDSSEYRHIRVTTKEKDLKVQAREGYYPSQQVSVKPGN